MRSALGALCLLAACAAPRPAAPRPATPRPAAPSPAARRGEEIVLCGRRVPVGTRVVLWSDPGGYDAYRGRHFGTRRPLAGDRLEDLQRVVQQVVLHYDAAGTSAQCFKVLEKRGLSCHFLLDRDGTIYQTLDLEERAWHAGRANDRSIGIEIANVGAYEQKEDLTRFDPLPAWVARGRLAADALADPGVPVRGRVHGVELWQYPFTEAQYAALSRLVRALVEVFPRLPAAVPGERTVMEDPLAYRGLLGHYHVTRGKIDPGPAFDWERLRRAVTDVPAGDRAGRPPAGR